MQTLVADHPLVAHKLTALRDVRTETPTFRRLTDELVTLLAYEATRYIKVEPVSVTTPVAAATARIAIFSAIPRSTPANSGAIRPWHR